MPDENAPIAGGVANLEPAMGIAALPSVTLLGFGLRPQPATPHWFCTKSARGRADSQVSTGHLRGFDSPHRALTRKAPVAGGLTYLEPAMGIEPITTGLQGRCSTIEPLWRVGIW